MAAHSCIYKNFNIETFTLGSSSAVFHLFHSLRFSAELNSFRCGKNTMRYVIICSGGSRISRRGGVHPLGGMDLRCGCFSLKMYAKTKELGPIGVACVRHAPPRSASDMYNKTQRVVFL